MTDEELTYPKKATRKRGANVAEQEQCKHGKRPPTPQKQHKNKPSLRSQPTSNKLKEAIHHRYSRLAERKTWFFSKEEETAGKEKG